MNEAYNIDCLAAMKETPDKFYDLAVVDPPYGIRQGGEKNSTRSRAAAAKDYHAFLDVSPEKEYFSELFRISKNQVIFGANHFISKIPFDSPSWVVWDKLNGENDFADCELAWTSFKTAARVFRFRWQEMLQGNMKNKECRIHPTQKPVQLYTWVYKLFSKEGDKILDTHLGSGSSRIAAYDMGLDFTGYEIDPVYFKAQEERFAAHTAQTSLFNQ